MTRLATLFFLLLLAVVNNESLHTLAFSPVTLKHLNCNQHSTASQYWERLNQPFSSSIKSTRKHSKIAGLDASVLSYLPTCKASNAHKVALLAGSTGLLSQISLSKLFRLSSYTAHSVVALVFLTSVTGIGAVGWLLPLFNGAVATTAPARLLTEDMSARWLAAVVCGMMGIWDLPTSLYVPGLRKKDVIAHHFVMTIIAYIAATQLPTRYVFFHLGFSELSSLPLLVYDQINHWIQNRTPNGNDKSLQWLIQARDTIKAVTALLFTIVRAIWFTKVTLWMYVPDVRSVLQPTGQIVTANSAAIAASGQAATLRFTMVAAIGFTALQLYWFYTQIVAVLWNDIVKRKSVQ